MESSIAQQAAIIFTAATVLIGLSLLLMTPTWRTIQETLDRLPNSQRKIVFNMRHIKDKRHKARAEMLLLLFLGCSCLAISIFLSLCSLIGTSATMVGLHMGPFQETNYNQAAYLLLASVCIFFSGFWSIGIVRIVEALRLRAGKASLLAYDDESAKSEETEKAKRDD